jgi:hypothetical protein
MGSRRELETQRAGLQRGAGSQLDAESARRHRGAVPLKESKRDGEMLFVFPDGRRHERRIQRATPGGADRLFWVTLTIACGAPGGRGSTQRVRALAKRFGHLAKARNDLDAYHQYYRPMRLGSPFVVGAAPGLGKCAGYFDHAIALDNPDRAAVLRAIAELRDWLTANQHDPEYRSFQFNFAFSGHGDQDPAGRPALVLADGLLGADELATLLISVRPAAEVNPAPCRLDLFLDCCRAGAIAETIGRCLATENAAGDTPSHSSLGVGQVYCACLGDEEAFEIPGLTHSVFTFAFLNECSRRRPRGATSTNLALRDIGWYTDGRQHPMLLDFTASGGGWFKFPPQYYLNRGPAARPSDLRAAQGSIDPAQLAFDTIGVYHCAAIELREFTLPIEKRIAADPTLREPYSRVEVLTNRRFPFL